MGIRRLIIYLIPLLFILSCNQKPKKRLIVGFAQCFSADDWRDKMVLDMQTEIIAYGAAPCYKKCRRGSGIAS